MINYNKKINFIRLISCIAVLLYHLGILKGGYLAVCTFFVLNGYLSCASAFKKETFSFKEYYLKKLKKLYLPLLIVIFITIVVISLIPNIFWINLKPETTSILLGYNNFWQLNANLDYFTRHVDSPFMHFWYIAILIQFEIVFPFIFVFLKKIEDKLKKNIPCLITLFITIILTLYFYFMSGNNNIMLVYYHTLTRIFSIFWGLSLGFIYCNYENKIKKFFTSIITNKIMFYVCLVILIVFFIFTDSSSPYFALYMIITTIISCVLLNYATIITEKKDRFWDKIINSLCSISYEIYLFQYPVIFLFTEINIDNKLKILLIIIVTIILSYLLHFCLSIKKNKKLFFVRFIVLFLFVISSIFGIYNYVIAKDYSEDMKALQAQLSENEQLLTSKQEEYMKKAEAEKNDWLETLENLKDFEVELKEIVAKEPIVGVGDSVMLGAIKTLYEQFPNSYLDAKISRTAWVANGIIKDLKQKKLLNGPIVFNLGANGDCSEDCKIALMNECSGHKVFWITNTNQSTISVNQKLFALSEKYDNLYIIDWEKISKGHSEYFGSDRIHLTGTGRNAYTKAIYDAIYQVYLDEYNAKKEAVLKEHEAKEKEKITFYGNNLLISVFDLIKDNYNDAKFEIKKETDVVSLKKELEKSISDKSITYRLVFAFDKEFKITKEEYQDIIKLCGDREVYIVSVNKEINKLNTKIIDFSDEINNDEYVFVDGIHLTENGKKVLSNKINQSLIKEN